MSTQAIRFLQMESARLQKENKALQEQIDLLQRYIDTMGELHRAADRMPSEEKPLGAFDQCLVDTMQVVGASDGSFAHLDPKTDELVFTLVHGMLEKRLIGLRIKRDQGVMGWVMENGEAVTVNEPRQDWRFSSEVDDEFSFLTRSLVCAPVIWQGRPVGVIELLNKEPQKFSKSDVTMLSLLCDVASAALTAMGSRTSEA
jgi:signal transduction protein with GAF and PtsI domain